MVDSRLLVKEHIANIGIPPDILTHILCIMGELRGPWRVVAVAVGVSEN